MISEFDRVSVIGLGYIGLPTAAVIAGRGIDVIGVDTNEAVVDIINQGKVHISEPDLDMLVQSAVNQGKLRAVAKPEPADVFIIAVPTPFTDGHKPNLEFLEAAAREVAQVLKKGNLVILESTVPVGTTERMVAWMSGLRPDLSFPRRGDSGSDIQVAHCPERVLPGQILRELIENDRIIGGVGDICSERAIALYDIFVRGQCIRTNARSAELCKLVENAYRDVNIAFANELSLISDQFEIDVREVIDLANRHPRVNILDPGPGVGGHCIAVDPWFIVSMAQDQSRLIRSARDVNDSQPAYVVEKIRAVAASLASPKIACFGLSYKADIDDLRESPSIAVVDGLCRGATGEVLVVEPNIDKLPKQLAEHEQLRLVTIEDALAAANVLVGLVGHHQFKAIESEDLEGKVVVDIAGVWRRAR